MEKKAQIPLSPQLIILILIIIFGILIVENRIEASQITSEPEQSNNFLGRNFHATQQIDLCGSLQAVNGGQELINQFENQCNILGGNWQCVDILVGCDKTLLPAIQCTDPDVKLLRTVCNNEGGAWSCDSRNIRCVVA